MGISGGLPAWTQPTFSNLSGTAVISQGGTGQTTALGAFNAISPLTTEGDLQYYYSSSNARLAIGPANTILTSTGTDPSWGALTGAGFGSQTANSFLASPNGSSGNPFFRSLVAADLPASITSNTSGNAATATALATAPSPCAGSAFALGIAASGNANCIGSQTANTIYAAPNGSSGAPAFRTLVASDLPTIAVSGGGTGQTTPSAAFNALSPLTTEGDLQYYSSNSNTRLAIGGPNTFLTSNGTDPSWGSLTGAGFGSQTANSFLAAPNGSSGAPAFRALVGSDLPTIAISGGGTGQTTTAAAFNTLSPLSAEGDLLFYHSSANTRLGAGGNGQCLVSNGTDPLWGSCSGSSSFAWSSLLNPTASLTLSLSAYATTFNHTSAANWTWANTTAATSGAAQSSPLFNLSGTYWNGSASAIDSWSLQDVVASGTNGNSTLTLAHNGSTGTATLSVPNLTVAGTTQYGVLYGGASSSTINSTAAGATGLPLLGQGSAPPVFGTLGIAGGGTGQIAANAGFNALSPLTTEGDLVYYHSSANARLARGSNGQCLTSNGTDPVWGSCSTGSGTVTSVGLSVPSLFSVSGSPVTGSGTLTAALANQNPNLIMAGPASGNAAAPSFRSLVGADLPTPTAGTLGGVESSSCANGQFLSQISTAGVPSCTTPTGITALGNGTTVIDASLQPGTDLASKVNAAIAACSPGPCTYDLRGFTGTQTMSASISFPPNSDVYMPAATINRASGAQFILSNYLHIHGPNNHATINSANVTSDYSAVFYAASNVAFVELDHLTIGPTTPSGPRLTLTSVASSSGGTAVYTGTITGGGSNAYAGYWFGVFGFAGLNNEGYFQCTASTTTALTLSNAQASAETPSGIAGGSFATQMGGWGINAPFGNSSIHDISMTSDLGLQFAPSGCTCYNNFWNLTLQTLHGALYFGTTANFNQGNDIKAWGGDEASAGFANATGYGLRINNGNQIEINGLDVENTLYSAVVRGDWIKITNFGFENDFAYGQGPLAAVSLPTIEQGSTNIVFDPSLPVADNTSGTNSIYNTYGYLGTRNSLYGSISSNPIDPPGNKYANVGQGSGATEIQYWAVPVDYNGNKALPISLGTPLNQTLGPYSLTLTQAVSSGSSTVYTGTITGGASGGLNGNSFTISGFTNAGNNGTFTCPTSTATTLTCNNANGVNETTAASAASDAYNAVSITGQFGTKCYDILKGDQAHSLALCLNASLFPYNDNGTTATVGGYSAPTRDATGNAHFTGALSTTKNVLDDGNGNITASSKMTAPQFCAGSSCVTSLWANPLTSLGDLLYGGASGGATRLPGNTSTTPMYFKSVGASGVASAPTLAQVQFSDLAGTLGVGAGGTGQTTAAAAFNALSPLTTEGDLHYYHAASNTRLTVGGANTFLTSNGIDPSWGFLTGPGFGSQTANSFLAAPNGSSGNPSFRSLVAADLPASITSNTTGNASTATALATTPSQCSTGQFATGIAASGNANCGTPTGGSTTWPSAAGIPNYSGSSSWGTSYGVSGTGNVCLTTNCVMTTPNLGTPAVLTLTNATGLPYSALTGTAPTWNQNTTGNAATATALGAAPLQCSGAFATGIAANGNANCTVLGQTSTRAVSGTTDPVAASDAGNWVIWTGSSSGTETLNTAAALGVPGFSFNILNATTGSATTVTVSATSWLIYQNANGSGASTLSVAQGQYCFIFVSPVGGAWGSECHETQITAGSNIAFSRSASGGLIVSLPSSISSNTTGTAAALGATPTQCSGGQFATGVAASGNANCAQPSASNLSNGVTGSGAAVLATSPTISSATLSGTATIPAAASLSAAAGGANVATCELLNCINITSGPYYASGAGATTTTTSGSTTAGSTSVTVASASTFVAGEGIYIAGAGQGISGTYTYVSGGSATGTGTCVAVPTSGVNAIATVNVTSGTITGGLTIQYAGTTNASSAPASWTLSMGTATTTLATATTCSGTITTTGGSWSTVQYLGTIANVAGNVLTVSPATAVTVSSGALIQHDETNAFQSAINSLASTGGVIKVPDGDYLINGLAQNLSTANAIIQIPNYGTGTSANYPLIGITIEGSTTPSLNQNYLTNTNIVPTQGAIIQTSATSGSLIGAYNPVGPWSFTNYLLTLERLYFRSYSNPSVTMVNGAYLMSLVAEYVTFDTGVVTIPAQPTNANGVGLIMPNVNNNGFDRVKEVSSVGYYTGLEIAEHSRVDSYWAFADLYGMGVNNAIYPMIVDKVVFNGCTHGIIANSSAPIKIHSMVAEHQQTASWMTSVDNIHDPSNNLNGRVDYEVHNSSGAEVAIGLSGAGNLVLTQLNTLPVEMATATNYGYTRKFVNNANDESFVNPVGLYAPSISTGKYACFDLSGGNETGTNAGFSTCFYYAGNNSTSNRWNLVPFGAAGPVVSVLASGNAGIGTTSPVSKLTVNGAVSNGVATSTNTDNRGHITLVSGTGSYTFTQGPGTGGIWTTAPVCIIQDDTTMTNIGTSTKTVTTSTLTITGSVGTTDTYSYICWPGN